jgi:hypothetical protein
MSDELEMQGQYYLHENGSVIYKRLGGVEVEPGGFVRRVWEVQQIAETPEKFMTWLMELLALGADVDRVIELEKHNDLGIFVDIGPLYAKILERGYTNGR